MKILMQVIKGHGGGKNTELFRRGETGKMDARYVPFIKRMFNWVFCPECGKRMKRVNSLYGLCWKCPECDWLTWYSPKK